MAKCYSLKIALFFIFCSIISCLVSGDVGVNWGTQATHRLASKTVVKLLMDNGIKKVKLYDADYGAMKALGDSGIEVMVGIPNDMLQLLASSIKAAEKWVAKNVTHHAAKHNVNIRY
jgi:hypothetical protein